MYNGHFLHWCKIKQEEGLQPFVTLYRGKIGSESTIQVKLYWF